MWLARCTYIQKLLEPRGFENNMSFVYRMAGRPYNRISDIGSGRFAAERWVTSHPDLEPCDLYAGHYKYDYTFDRSQMAGTWVPRLYEGFRFPLRFYFNPGTTWFQWVQWRCQEWHKLYQKLPGQTSLNTTWRFQEVLEAEHPKATLPKACQAV
jgi:hypothetical protein